MGFLTSFLLAAACAAGAAENTAPVKLIIDTDIGGGGCNDVDDVVAISIANVSNFMNWQPLLTLF